MDKTSDTLGQPCYSCAPASFRRMTTSLGARARVEALTGLVAAPAARGVFLAVLDRALCQPVRFRIGDDDLVVGVGSTRGECAFSVRVVAPEMFTSVLCFGNLGLGEAYMRGDFVMETGRLEDLLTLLLRSRLDEEIRRSARLVLKAAAIQLRNGLRTRREAVQRHYDFGTDLYEAFLDSTLTYSCGYARVPEDSLETLQQNKFTRVCQKLRLEPGERVLDLGCGFGGLLIFAAEHYGACGTGVTISRSQQEWATREIRRRGLTGRVDVLLMDYRAARGQFDKVVSVGLLEHVAPSEYDRFFSVVAGALKPSSIGLVHAIGTTKPGSRHDPFIQKYVFPKSHQIRLPPIVTAMERAGLAVLDVENMVRHYALTVLAWLKRFRENCSSLDRNRYNETFCRMWEYYLACGVAAARASDAALYQVLFHNDRAAPVPLQRV